MSGNVLAWGVQDGCEIWAGTLTLNGDGSQMEGPIANDISSCTSGGSQANGTLRLDRQ